MLNTPKYLKTGDEINVQWPNSVVDALKYNFKDPENDSKNRKTRRKFDPFDVTSYKLSGDSYVVKLCPGLYYEYEGDGPTQIKYGETELKDYPSIFVETNKDLYFNYKTKKLEWHETDCPANLKILEIAYVGGGTVTFNNVHPFNIDLRDAKPFLPLISKTVDEYTVALIPGLVCERVPGVSNALINHEPKELRIEALSGGGLEHHVIEEGKQLSITVKVNESGNINALSGDAVALSIDVIDEDSTHYIVKCGDDQIGAKGVYYYKMVSFEDNAFTIFNSGSHLSHYHEVPQVDNTVVTPEGGKGRIVESYDSSANRFRMRVMREKLTEPQVRINEDGDFVEVRGNSLSGLVTYQFEEDSPQDIVTWDDGLHTLALETDILVPKYVGDGETVNVSPIAGNTYTISAIVSALSAETITLSAGPGISIVKEENNYTISTTLTALSGKDGYVSVQYGNESGSVLAEFNDGLYIEPGDEQIVFVPTYNAGPGISITPDGENEYTVSTNLSSLSGKDLNLEVYATTFYHTVDETFDIWSITQGTTPEQTLYFRNGLFVGIVDPGYGSPITQHISQNLGL